MISFSIFPISIVFCTLKNPQNDTKIIILPLLVKKLWNGLKRMAAILFLCKWGQKVLVGHASMSEMICKTINYYHAKLNNSTQKCRVQYILDRLHGPLNQMVITPLQNYSIVYQMVIIEHKACLIWSRSGNISISAIHTSIIYLIFIDVMNFCYFCQIKFRIDSSKFWYIP